jgi:hypothetical protein
MFFIAEAVEDLSTIAEMVERIDMGAAVGVHRDAVAGITNQHVGLQAGVHGVGDDFAGGRMGHPDLVGLVARSEPAGHADEIVYREIEHLGRVGTAEDRRTRLRIDEVQHADLIIFPIGATGDLMKFGVVGDDLLLRRFVDIARNAHGALRA